jgi:hypothetical protein
VGNAVHEVLTGLTSVYVGGPVLLLLLALLLARELLLVLPADRLPGPWVQRLESAARVMVRPLALMVGLILLIKVLL